MTQKYAGLRVKYPFSYQSLIKLEISQQMYKNKNHAPNLMQIHPVGAECCRADWRGEANSRFPQFRERA
jgi:hypothetical protein